MAWPCSLPEAQAEMAPAYDMKLGAQPPLCAVVDRHLENAAFSSSPRQRTEPVAQHAYWATDPIHWTTAERKHINRTSEVRRAIVQSK